MQLLRSRARASAVRPGHSQSERNSTPRPPTNLGWRCLRRRASATRSIAPHCCGPARDRRLDDVGFIDASVARARALLRWRRTSRGVSGLLERRLHGVAPRQRRGRTRWRAAAPVSGHEFAVRAASPMPVFIHHCAADSMVRFDGCCRADSLLGQARHVLLRHRHERDALARERPGAAQAVVRAQPLYGLAHLHVGRDGRQVRHAGVGCAASSDALCAHANGCSSHQQWARDFPAATEIVAWRREHTIKSVR